jgi:hypothetical protein
MVGKRTILLSICIAGLLGGCGGKKEKETARPAQIAPAKKDGVSEEGLVQQEGGAVAKKAESARGRIVGEAAGGAKQEMGLARQRLVDSGLSDEARMEAAGSLLSADVEGLVRAYGEGENARIIRKLIEERAEVADEEVLPLIAGLFEKVQGEERIDFEQYFLAFDRRPVERLITPLLRADDRGLAMRAMDTLAKMKSKVGADSIASLLQHPEEWRRIGAAHAIGEIGGDRAVGRLMGVLDDPVYSVVNAGLVGLGRLEAKTAYERISGMLTDENLHVRKHAAIALGEIGDRRAIPEVRQLAKEDPDSGVRFMAGRALKKLEGTP